MARSRDAGRAPGRSRWRQELLNWGWGHEPAGDRSRAAVHWHAVVEGGVGTAAGWALLSHAGRLREPRPRVDLAPGAGRRATGLGRIPGRICGHSGLAGLGVL